MKVSTQEHIRDVLGLLPAIFATPLAYADLVKPLAEINPKIAHAWPFFLASSPLLARGFGTICRLYNRWYPPKPESPPQQPTTPQP